MEQIAGLADIKSSTEGGNPELQIRFDRDRLANFGLSLGHRGTRGAIQSPGDHCLRYPTRGPQDRYPHCDPVKSFASSAQDLRNLTVHQQGKTAIPLECGGHRRGGRGSGGDPSLGG